MFEAEIWYDDSTHNTNTKSTMQVEDDLWQKMTFGGRRTSVEDDLWWKTTYGGRRPSVEDNVWWKMILAYCLVRFAVFQFYDTKIMILVKKQKHECVLNPNPDYMGI